MNCRNRIGAAAPRTGALLALTLGACDAQVSPFYRGESLLTVVGSVEIAENRTPAPLVPALAFASRARNEILVVEAQVQGRFPADFRLDVYDPPPSAALGSTSELFESEERMALGYITAVPQQHRAVIRFGDTQDSSSSACSSAGCATTTVRTWCTSTAEIDCYEETIACPEGAVWSGEDDPPADCMITAQTGDIALKEPWREFAGFSQNYLVLYLPSPAPSGSYIASAFGAPSGLERGYHLLAIHSLNEQQYTETQACVAEAIASAVADYNQAHGTHYTADEAQEPAVSKALGVASQRAEVDLGCWQIAPRFTLVDERENTSISVRIGTDTPPDLAEADES